VKLLIFISSLDGGGAERVTVNLANYWAAKGWEITIVTLASQRDDFYELNRAVTRISLNLAGDSGNLLLGLVQNIRRLVALRQVLRQIQPSIALSMMTDANVLLALASCGQGRIRTIGSERIHPPQCPLGGVWEWLRRYSYSQLDVIVALTNVGADWLKKHTGARRVVVIPNSVSWPMPNQMPHLDVETVARTGRSLLLAVGRLSNQKQFSLLIESFKFLADRHSDWDMVILGEGPLRSALEMQVQDANLVNRVFLPGRAGNVGDWYERANLFVLSSRFEGFPNTLVEAMAYGLPAVSFDCDTGPREIIRDGLDGLLVPPGSAVGLISALDQLMGNEYLRQKLAARAVEVRERFAVEQIAEQWAGLFAFQINELNS
jgi:glycosyltransferase involved in cell wall biosynthesis